MLTLTLLNLISYRKFLQSGLLLLFNLGPNHWGEQYNTCFGKFQSPIDINSLFVKQIHLQPLDFIDIDLSLNKTLLRNNGHTGIQLFLVLLILVLIITKTSESFARPVPFIRIFSYFCVNFIDE